MYKEAISKTYVHNADNAPYGSLAIISKLIGKNKRVLDIGCSSGYLSKYCPENEFYGIDGNSEAIDMANRTYKKAIVVDLNQIPDSLLFDVKFDYIIFADILEHLLYPELLLKHFAMYLNNGGKVIVSLPNIALWRNRFNLLFGHFDYTDFGVMDRTHLHLYTYSTAKQLLQNSGYRVEEQVGAAYATGRFVNLNQFLKNLLSVHIITIAKL